MSVRTQRTRMLIAAALTAATLTLTACNDGQGVKDEGASTESTPTESPSTTAPSTAPTAPATPSSGATAGTSTGAGQADPARQTDPASSTSGGSTGSKDPAPASASVPCDTTSTRMAATVVSRPLNHLLLTLTNTGSKNCDLVGYPAVRLGDDAQSVPPAIEDSKPQAVVTLAPGESGYASVVLSAADGSGANGYTAKSLTVHFGERGSARPSLPAKGVYVDDSVQVTYWQYAMADALTW